MRASNFRAVHRLTGIFGLCLCLALLGTIILGAADSNAASSATGSLPDIKAFSADPMTLPDGGFAMYKFEVSGATYLQLTEAGAIIKEINSPPSTNLKGTAKGRTTNEIRTGDMNTFDAVLIVRNAGGEQKKTLTLSFVTKIQPPSSSDNRTKARTPKWGPLSIIPLSLTQAATKSGNAPQFTKCTDTCNYCLRPDDAAARGFTQKCSESLCYYSPDNQQKWYCYSEPKGWCCKEGPVGQTGQVTEATKSQCSQAGGDYWSIDRNEATQACQALGYCCRDGQIAQMSRAQCAQQQGSYWSTDQAQVRQACQPIGWFCSGGNIYQGTQAQAAQSGVTWYPTQAQAVQACRVTYWCCNNGQVYQTTSYTDGCYKTQAEAVQACQACWCCSGGKVYQTSPAACSRAGGACYSSQSQAAANCRYQTPLLK